MFLLLLFIHNGEELLILTCDSCEGRTSGFAQDCPNTKNKLPIGFQRGAYSKAGINSRTLPFFRGVFSFLTQSLTSVGLFHTRFRRAPKLTKSDWLASSRLSSQSHLLNRTQTELTWCSSYSVVQMSSDTTGNMLKHRLQESNFCAILYIKNIKTKVASLNTSQPAQ